MRARFATLATCTSLTALLAACGGSGAPSTPTMPGGGGGGTGQEAITITIPSSDGYGESSFSPGSVTIAVGRTVTWENKDSIAHTTTSNTAGLWNGQMGPTGTFSRTFTAAGTFDYRCTIHPGMSGSITAQ
jgi:plastocyanin